jgi:glycosyltransferase involved in cell wall biosynthesis
MNPPKILSIWLSPSYHQIPLAEELYNICGDNYRIAFLDPSEEFRSVMKWPKINILKSWIIRTWENETALSELSKWNTDADLVIYPNYFNDYKYCRKLMKQRFSNSCLCMSTGDRYFKPRSSFMTGWCETSPEETLRPLRHIIRRLRSLQYAWSINKSNFHYLALGAYSTWDQRRIGMFKNRLWTWGYYTATSQEFPSINSEKRMRILWAGRMIRLKNVHILIEACARLKQKNIDFELTLIGDGPEKKQLQELSIKRGTSSSCVFMDIVTPDAVREFMRSSNVYVQPSTADEGWGAVLNEAMSEGCTVIGSTGAGASRILIKDGENGLLFPTGDAGALAEQLEYLARNPEKREEMGRNAARYMRDVWSPAVGAERLVHLANGLLGREPMPFYTEGPCSPAKIWKDKKNDRAM